MFKLVMENPRLIKSIFNSVNSIVDEVAIDITPDKLEMIAIDRAHITFVHLVMEKGLFEEYQCDKPMTVCIDTEEFKKVLARGKVSDILTLTYEEKTGSLVIIFEMESRKTFKIGLIDIEDDVPRPPTLDYPVILEVPFKHVKDCLGDVAVFSEKLTISYKDSVFKMKGKSEFGSGQVDYILEPENKVDDKTYESSFSLVRVKEICKGGAITENVEIQIGHDMPLQLTFRMPEEMFLQFLLAPQIATDE